MEVAEEQSRLQEDCQGQLSRDWTDHRSVPKCSKCRRNKKSCKYGGKDLGQAGCLFQRGILCDGCSKTLDEEDREDCRVVGPWTMMKAVRSQQCQKVTVIPGKQSLKDKPSQVKDIESPVGNISTSGNNQLQNSTLQQYPLLTIGRLENPSFQLNLGFTSSDGVFPSNSGQLIADEVGASTAFESFVRTDNQERPHIGSYLAQGGRYEPIKNLSASNRRLLNNSSDSFDLWNQNTSVSPVSSQAMAFDALGENVHDCMHELPFNNRRGRSVLFTGLTRDPSRAFSHEQSASNDESTRESWYQRNLNENIRDQYGNNMLHLAVWNEDLGLVQKLVVEYRWYTESANYNNETPLIIAVIKNNIKIVESLLEAKALPDGIDFCNGTTALREAVIRGNVDIARLLVNRGANPDGKPIDSDLRSPYTIAIESGNPEMMELFKDTRLNPFQLPHQSGITGLPWNSAF